MSCPPSLLMLVKEFKKRNKDGKNPALVSYTFDEMEVESLAYVSTQPNILEILSKRGRTSLADNLKYNLEITNDQYAEIKKVWLKQKGYKELIKEMEERSEPFDAEP